jgi:hypothetical protein
MLIREQTLCKQNGFPAPGNSPSGMATRTSTCHQSSCRRVHCFHERAGSLPGRLSGENLPIGPVGEEKS